MKKLKMSESAFLSNRAIESKCFIRAQGMTMGAGTFNRSFTLFWKKRPNQHSTDPNPGQNISLMEIQHAYVDPACMWKCILKASSKRF